MKLKLVLKYSIFSLFFLGSAIIRGQTDTNTSIQKNIEVFESYFKALNNSYVDKINPERLLRIGIDAIDQSLDPFTVFLTEEDVKSKNNAWKGFLFTGIGVGLYQRDSGLCITEIYEAYPAQKADLRIGDLIVKADTFILKNLNFAESVSHIKGEEGSRLQLEIIRPGIGKIRKTVERKKIISPSVPYYGMINDSVGYIKCTQFLENAYDSMRFAFSFLKKQYKLSGLVLDFRDNMGGLVQEAINTANLFLPKGKLICDLKSENNQAANYSYTSLYEPMDTLIPIVVLSNANSISAAEIVLGAFQDYDRAVIIGQKSWGKGYVQGTQFLAQNTQLYVTSARYYTPSGRCIQELDYSHKYIDNMVNKYSDTLKKEFYTQNHRMVFNLGGILPDIVFENVPAQPIIQSVSSGNWIRDFASFYRNTHDYLLDIKTWSLSEKEYSAFEKELYKDVEHIITPTDIDLKIIEEHQNESQFTNLTSELKSLHNKLQRAKIKAIKKVKTELRILIESEIVRCYFPLKYQMQYNFDHSTLIKEALQVLSNRKKYNLLLNKE